MHARRILQAAASAGQRMDQTQETKRVFQKAPIIHKLEGMRLLQQSRRFLKCMSTWALLYRLYGDIDLRDRALEEMERTGTPLESALPQQALIASKFFNERLKSTLTISWLMPPATTSNTVFRSGRNQIKTWIQDSSDSR